MNSSIISPVSESIVVCSCSTLTQSWSLGGGEKMMKREKKKRKVPTVACLFWPNQRRRGSILCHVEVVWHLCGPSPPSTSTPLPLWCVSCIAKPHRNCQNAHVAFLGMRSRPPHTALAHNRAFRITNNNEYVCVSTSITNVAKYDPVVLLMVYNYNEHIFEFECPLCKWRTGDALPEVWHGAT